MQLPSANVSLPVEVSYRGNTVTTGIFIEPVGGRVMLRTLNLDGDGQAALVGHAEIHKAAHAYSVENHDRCKRELGRTGFPFGKSGGNLADKGKPEDRLSGGDVLREGDASVEVTQSRVSCFKPGMIRGLLRFVKMFLAGCRAGACLRAPEEGEVGAGQGFDRVRTDPERMTVREICQLPFFGPGNLGGAQKALRIQTLPQGRRQPFEGRSVSSGANEESGEEPGKERKGCGP
jgi:MOSC domain-containing protein YiiM